MKLLEPGQVFAERYRIERFLAKGGMGAVFVATHQLTEMRVALKVLHPEIVASSVARERFELEARVAARVNSEHIVKVIDAGADSSSGLPFIVMELLDGRSLEDLVEERGPMPPALAVELLDQVAKGLDQAHGYVDAEGNKRPIVHRDLKPENIFIVQPDSAKPLVKILDFGIAKVLSDTSNVSQELRGTPLYMAYEQAMGEVVTPQTDVWALGLIAFYALTARPYWKSISLPGGNLNSLFSEILALPLAPASQRKRELGIEVELPPEFDTWLSRCLTRKATDRFGSASEAIFALAGVFDPSLLDRGMGPSAATARNFQRPPTPNPDRKSGAVAFGATVVAQTGSTADQLSVETTQYPLARPRRGFLLTGLGVALLAAIAVGYVVSSEPEGDTVVAPATTTAPPESPAKPDSRTANGNAEVAEVSSTVEAPAVAPLASTTANTNTKATGRPPSRPVREREKPAEPAPKPVDDPYGKR